MAAKLSGNIRHDDVVIRQGGEEFVVLLRQCALAPAAERADEIRGALEAMRIEIGPLSLTVTASFGLAEWTEAGGFEDALYLADQALYLAKRCGRNCVRVGIDEGSPAAQTTEPADLSRGAYDVGVAGLVTGAA